jgi:hypothetical protein
VLQFCKNFLVAQAHNIKAWRFKQADQFLFFIFYNRRAYSCVTRYSHWWRTKGKFTINSMHDHTTVSFLEGNGKPNLHIAYFILFSSAICPCDEAGLSSEELHTTTTVRLYLSKRHHWKILVHFFSRWVFIVNCWTVTLWSNFETCHLGQPDLQGDLENVKWNDDPLVESTSYKTSLICLPQ